MELPGNIWKLLNWKQLTENYFQYWKNLPALVKIAIIGKISAPLRLRNGVFCFIWRRRFDSANCDLASLSPIFPKPLSHTTSFQTRRFFTSQQPSQLATFSLQPQQTSPLFPVSQGPRRRRRVARKKLGETQTVSCSQIARLRQKKF